MFSFPAILPTRQNGAGNRDKAYGFTQPESR